MSAPPALMWRTSQRKGFCTGRKSRNLSGVLLGPELKPSATDRSCGKMEDLGKSHGGDQGIDFFVRMNGCPSFSSCATQGSRLFTAVDCNQEKKLLDLGNHRVGLDYGLYFGGVTKARHAKPTKHEETLVLELADTLL